MQEVTLKLTMREVDYIATILSHVPTGDAVRAGMQNLLPKIGMQAQEAIEIEKAAQELARQGDKDLDGEAPSAM